VQQRTMGGADIRVINPTMPDGREISVLEVLNDNMPFLFDSTMAELAEQGIDVTLVAHPIIAVERDGKASACASTAKRCQREQRASAKA